jgi:uncharacterized protein (TIGR03545 family)/uncharacterized protein (TIGR03546 family)
MRFFWKLFKALNSAQNPWQVTMAITLGMLAGLTPMAGIQNLLFLFIALILNIHFGLFLVASALFAGIGYLFDPMFESLGYMLLTSEGLQAFWSACYDNGLMRLTYFNNTLVLGSMLFALIIALPLQLLLGWAIVRYRDVLSALLSKYPKLGFMGVLQASEKKDRTFRLMGIGVFGGIVGVIALFLLFLLDPIMKWSLEYGASAALNRDVRIGDVNVDVAEGSITISTLEVAGDKEGIDALSIAKTAVDIDLNALLFQQTHVESIVMQGMGFDTKATLKKNPTIAEVVKAASKSAGEKVSTTAADMKMELPKPKDLLAQAGLGSQKEVDAAKKEIAEMKAKWEKVYNEELTSESIEPLKAEFKTLQKKAKTKDPAKLLALKGDIDTFKSNVKAYKKRLETIQSDFKKDQARIKVLMAKVKKAGEKDYAHLKSTYTLDGSGALNVVGALFGKEVQSYIAMGKKYYAMAEPYLKSEKAEEVPVPPRGEGRWITFPSKLPQPDLLVKTTSINGLLKSQAFDAMIKNITDDQKKLGKAMTFTLKSDGDQIKGLLVDGEDNRLGKTVKDVVNFKARNLPLADKDFGALQLTASDLALDGTITLSGGTTLDGTTNAVFNNAKMELPGQSALVSDIIKSIDGFNVKIGVSGSTEQPSVTATSDLDKKLSAALKKSMQKEVDKYQKELKVLMDEQMKANLGGLGEASGGMPDISGAAGGQKEQLGGFDTDSLLKKEGGLKSLLPF